MKKKYTVLVVDDAFFIRNLIKRAVGNKPSADYSYEFELIGEGLNGEEGLLLYKSLRPDIVTADINMGSLGGVKFIKAVQKINPKAKIIIISSSLDNKIKSEVAELGCYYIQKPFQEAYLWTKLDTIAEELMKDSQIKRTNKSNQMVKKEKETIKQDKVSVIENKENNKKEKEQLTKENEKSFHKNENISNENKNKNQSNKNKQNKKKENNQNSNNNKNNNHKKSEKQNVLAGFVVEDGLSIHTLKNNTESNIDKSATVKESKREPHKKKEQSKNNVKKESSKEFTKAPKSIPTLEVVEDIVIPPRKVIKDVKANVIEVKRAEPEINDLGIYEDNEVIDLNVKPKKIEKVKAKINKPINETTNTKKHKEMDEVIENKVLEVIPAEIEESVLIVEEPLLEVVEPIIEELEVENEPTMVELDNVITKEVIINEDKLIQENIDSKETLICDEKDDEIDLLIIDEIEVEEKSKEEEIIIDEVLEDEDLLIIEDSKEDLLIIEEEEVNQVDNKEDLSIIEDSTEELIIIDEEDEEELVIEDSSDELIILDEDEMIEPVIEDDILIIEDELVIGEVKPQISIEETDILEIEFENEVLEETKKTEENSIENELLMGLSYDLDVELTQRKPQSTYNPKLDFEFSIEEELLKQEETSSYEHKSKVEEKIVLDEEEDKPFNFSDTIYSDMDDDDDWDLFNGEAELEFDISNEYDNNNDKNMYDNTDYANNMELNHDDFDYNKPYTSNRANGAVKISPPKDNIMKEIYSKKMEEEYSIGFKKEEPVKVEEPVEKKKVGLFSKIFKKRKRN